MQAVIFVVLAVIGVALAKSVAPSKEQESKKSESDPRFMDILDRYGKRSDQRTIRDLPDIDFMDIISRYRKRQDTTFTDLIDRYGKSTDFTDIMDRYGR